jgi:hypothetical protein
MGKVRLMSDPNPRTAPANSAGQCSDNPAGLPWRALQYGFLSIVEVFYAEEPSERIIRDHGLVRGSISRVNPNEVTSAVQEKA